MVTILSDDPTVYQVELAIRSALRIVNDFAPTFAAWANTWLDGEYSTEPRWIVWRTVRGKDAAWKVSALARQLAEACERDADSLHHGYRAQERAASAALLRVMSNFSASQEAADDATWHAGRSLFGPVAFTDRKPKPDYYSEPELLFSDWSYDSKGRLGRNYDYSEV